MQKEDYSQAMEYARVLIGADQTIVITTHDLFAIQNACNYVRETKDMTTASQVKNKVNARTKGLENRIKHEQA